MDVQTPTFQNSLKVQFAIAAATATVVFIVAPAEAGSLEEPTPQPVVAVPAPVAPGLDWGGLYAGAQIGTIASGDLIAGITSPVDGEVYGAFGGYRFDLGAYVIGGEIDYMVGKATIASPTVAPATFDADIDRLVRIGVEAGIEVSRALLYGTVGYADIELTDPTGDPISSGGYFYGLGVDYQMSERVTLGAELLQHEFSSFASDGTELDLLTFGLNVGVQF